uniref:Uncharacterized protein n=1 Tax=Steinernema glaseri TaxID=37863 RepID=A0A1I7YGA4_9BILA
MRLLSVNATIDQENATKYPSQEHGISSTHVKPRCFMNGQLMTKKWQKNFDGENRSAKIEFWTRKQSFVF